MLLAIRVLVAKSQTVTAASGSILQRLEAGNDYRPVDALRQAQAVLNVLAAATGERTPDSAG
ncbi:MAG: hypothetical protein ABIQ58_10290 [Candidatus Limnocylindrales bacterium]